MFRPLPPELRNLTVISRLEWGAVPARDVEYLTTPVAIVLIHHTVTEHCFTVDVCSKIVREMQNFHMELRDWDDLGYNFVVGEDGNVYEGRGWNRVGTHTQGWNRHSVSIAVIGNYMLRTPNEDALLAAKAVIALGVHLGKVTLDYSLYAHRDARPTEGPGDAFYNLILSWDHYNFNKPIKPKWP